MISKHLLILTMMLLTIAGCADTAAPDGEPHTELLYSNGFENASDSVGWAYAGNVSVYLDATLDTGRHCLNVSGTDIGPQAERILDTLREAATLILRYDARCIGHTGGEVRLLSFPSAPPFPRAGSTITDTIWGAYSDTAAFPAGYPLRIWIDGNGTFETPVLVDNIRVMKIVR